MKAEDRPVKLAPRKTTQVLLFTGALGWTAFALTCLLWSSATVRNKKILATHEEENYRQVTAVEKKGQQITNEQKEIVKLRDSEIKRLNETIAKLNKDLATEQACFSSFLAEVHSSYEAQPPTKEALEAWLTLLSKHPSSDSKFNQRVHSKVAEGYYSLGLYDEAKLQLELSNDFDPTQKKRIFESLDLDSAMVAVESAIAKKLDKAEISQRLKHARSLLEKLAHSKEKTALYSSLSSKLLSLETKVVLEAPPKEALEALDKLVTTLEPIAKNQQATLVQRLHYLDSATKAYGLAAALNQAEQAKRFKATVVSASKLVKASSSKDTHIYYSQAIVLLAELDALFLEGDAAEILKVASELEAVSTLGDDNTQTIFQAAASGHKAAVYFEKGQITKGRDTLSTAISKLKALCDKEKENTLAQFRLGILFWLQAQLTTSSNVTFNALSTSIDTLKPIIPKAPVTELRQIRQFAAMVEGDLGHLTANLGRKDTAKTHFSNALAHWVYIVDAWGENEETKEGLSYCKWRIDKL